MYIPLDKDVLNFFRFTPITAHLLNEFSPRSLSDSTSLIRRAQESPWLATHWSGAWSHIGTHYYVQMAETPRITIPIYWMEYIDISSFLNHTTSTLQDQIPEYLKERKTEEFGLWLHFPATRANRYTRKEHWAIKPKLGDLVKRIPCRIQFGKGYTKW